MAKQRCWIFTEGSAKRWVHEQKEVRNLVLGVLGGKNIRGGPLSTCGIKGHGRMLGFFFLACFPSSDTKRSFYVTRVGLRASGASTGTPQAALVLFLVRRVQKDGAGKGRGRFWSRRTPYSRFIPARRERKIKRQSGMTLTARWIQRERESERAPKGWGSNIR